MFNLFKKNKATINAITIPHWDWNLTKEDANIRQWINAEQTMALSVNFFDVAPDIPTLQSIDTLRDYYREQLIPASGGLIQVDSIEMSGFKVIKTIFKIQPEGEGTTYLTSLTIPFERCSYVIKIQAPVYGATGMRESIIADRMMKENKIQINDAGETTGWTFDPYKKDFIGGTLMNLSERMDYDGQFPSHPLSISRRIIQDIENSTTFDDILRSIPPFQK